jgi:glycosyltransferase involved in cell wall biosynthesis
MTILFVHLLNDRSGSPRVLKNVIQACVKNGLSVKLIIGSQGKGVLSELLVPTQTYPYRRFSNKYFTLFSYVSSQLALFLTLLLSRDARQASLVYINTVLPFGAALFAKLFKIRVIYHIHEVSVTPKPLAWFLKNVIRMTASKVLYVSKAHLKLFPIKNINSDVLYNGYDEHFSYAADCSYKPLRDGKFRVLMLASMRGYKGLSQFVELSKRFSNYDCLHFDLVLNDEHEKVLEYRKTYQSDTLTIHLPTSQPGSFYQRVSLLVNLSLPNLVIETFGLTLLEAMTFGVPVIAPPIGGPSEIVRDSVEGFLIDSREIDTLEKTIGKLVEQPDVCMTMSIAARKRAQDFSPEFFSAVINKHIFDVLNNNCN